MRFTRSALRRELPDFEQPPNAWNATWFIRHRCFPLESKPLIRSWTSRLPTCQKWQRHLLTWGTSNFHSGFLCVPWLRLEKRLIPAQKLRNVAFLNWKEASRSFHPSPPTLPRMEGDTGRPLLTFRDHQGKAAPSLPWAFFPNLNPPLAGSSPWHLS